VRERALHQPKTQRPRQRIAVARQVVQHLGIVLRPHDDADVLPVLRGAAHHRRAADVDVLDRLRKRGIAPRHRLAEGVQVHGDEIDGGEPAGGHRLHMLGHVTPREYAGVHFRMQGLHPAIEHLGKAGVIGDFGHGQAGLAQELRGTAGRNEPHAEPRESLREFEHTGLVGDAQERLFDDSHESASAA
jgi:hypothetical protein